MKRVLLGSALPVLTLGLAGVFLSPSLFEGRSGEPLRVVSTEAPSPIQLADYSGEACALATHAGGTEDMSGLRIVTLTVGSGSSSVALAEIPLDASPGGATVVLLLDGAGRLLAVGDADSLSTDAAREALAVACEDAEAADAI